MPTFTIGTEFIGEVDTINQQSIQTKFFVFGIPLIPLESYYILGKTFQGIQGFPIGLNLKSVLVAYLRWWVAIPTGMLVVFAIALRELICIVPVLIGVGIILSTNVIGRLSKKEKLCRQTRIDVTGIGAPPKIMPEKISAEIYAKLVQTWNDSSFSTYHGAWEKISSVNSIPGNLLPLYYCLALYAKNEPLAEKAWQIIESNIPMLP